MVPVMNIHPRRIFAGVLASAPLCCSAADSPGGCEHDQLDAHVREQIQLYGPRSAQHEHFAFVYLYQGAIASAVIRSSRCTGTYSCSVHTDASAKLIPKGARVLGEWHTHPHQGSATLSADDVRGAYNNRRIRCYAAYYAKPGGDILAWDPRKDSVPTAMFSAVRIGSYRDGPAPVENAEIRHAGMAREGAPLM